MSTRIFGYSTLVGEDVTVFSISNERNTRANILSLGAAVQSLYLPWKGVASKGDEVNVVLGFDRVEDYETNDCYIGVAVGRVAGRISHGRFSIDGDECCVTANHGSNCLHGGNVGISRKNWTLVELLANSVTLKCLSVHGEEGFPGEMEIAIKYTITADNSLSIEYKAHVTQFASPVNLTNHSYFNLSGLENVDRGIRDHVVNIQSSSTLELDVDLLPTGKVVPLASTLDLRESSATLDSRLPLVGGTPSGFDNYYIFDRVDADKCQATVSDGVTTMSLYTDQRGVQFYTANFFDRVACSGGLVHRQYGALCLEAQGYPDAVNHAAFPCIVIRPGEQYVQKTVYKFGQV